MSHRIINPVTTSPDFLRPGDVIAVTVTLYVMNVSASGVPIVAAYRCPFPDAERESGIPQGDALLPNDAKAVAQAVAPGLFAGRKVLYTMD